MGFSDIVRGGVALADNLTADLQPQVIWRRWTGDTGMESSYDPVDLSIPALIDRKQQLIRGSDGREIVSKTSITLLRPLTAHGAAGRNEPIDERDVFILPDGSTGPIINIGGFVDRETGRPYFHEVYLG